MNLSRLRCLLGRHYWLDVLVEEPPVPKSENRLRWWCYVPYCVDCKRFSRRIAESGWKP